MIRGTAGWTAGMAVAALLALPVTGSGQDAGPRPAAAQGTSDSTEAQETAAHRHRLAQEHLHEAHTELAGLRDDALTTDVQSRVATLKRHLSALQRTDSASADASPAETLAAIDRILTELLGAEPASAPRTDAPVGTTGASPARVEGNTKAVLQKVRTHLAAYAGAARSVEATEAHGSAASAAGSSQAAPPTGATATPATSPTDPTPTATGTASTAEPHVPSPPDHASPPRDAAGSQPPAAPPFDAERVKLHLTAARNALADMTRLPEAAEISGESRTQVSQLITDFNEMIANETAWHKSLEKVKANLQTILTAPPEERAATDASEPGVVGTSGRSGLAPEIRAKLVEFRSHLEAFEAAVTAGARAVGTVSAHDADPIDSPHARHARADAVAGSDGAPGRTAYDARHAEQTASRPPVDATPAQANASGTPRDALRHIEAIEALLAAAQTEHRDQAARTDATPQPVGTSGRTAPAHVGEPGLDSAQVAAIREHLRQLRHLLDNPPVR